MGDEEKKIQEEATEKAQAEYDAAWDGKEEKADKKDEGTTEDEKSKAPEESDEAKKKAEEEKSKDHGTVASLEKALKDTKAELTKVQQEMKKLESKASDTAKETQEKVDAAQAALDELVKNRDKILEDYPELKPMLDAQIAQAKKLTDDLSSLKADNEKKAKEDKEKEKKLSEKEAFERDVKPHIVTVHPDFDAIIQSESYWKWAEEQKPGLKFMAMNSPDPDDINHAIGEFKKSKYAKEIKSLKDKEEAERKKRINDAQALRGGSRSLDRTGDSRKDPEDYEAGWKEADEILKKQGVA